MKAASGRPRKSTSGTAVSSRKSGDEGPWPVPRDKRACFQEAAVPARLPAALVALLERCIEIFCRHV